MYFDPPPEWNENGWGNAMPGVGRNGAPRGHHGSNLGHPWEQDGEWPPGRPRFVCGDSAAMDIGRTSAHYERVGSLGGQPFKLCFHVFFLPIWLLQHKKRGNNWKTRLKSAYCKCS